MEDRKYSSTFQGVDLDKIEGGVSQSISLKNDQNEDHSTSIKLDAFRTSEWQPQESQYIDSLIQEASSMQIEDQQIDDSEINVYDVESIATMPLTLQNLVRVSRPIFKMLEVCRNKSIIMACGNTGCGKSTMFNSLIHGVKSLSVR